MATIPITLVPWLAQTPAKPLKTQPVTTKTQTTQPPPPRKEVEKSEPLWLYTTGGLMILLVGLGVFAKLKFDRVNKQVRFETFKNRELQRKLKLAVATIGKMERNPDLIHSREFNLDYLRLRMDEEVFHFAILNQIKIKVKDKITIALRPNATNQNEIGIATTGRQVDQVFDVEYEPGGDALKGTKRVLFRIEIKILKLPTQPTSVTIGQIIDCIESFLSHSGASENWQPTIQGRIANMRWDQKAKPTPLLVLEQTQDGSNVTFKTTRMAAN